MFRKLKKGEYMEYTVKELAQHYAEYLSHFEIEIKSPVLPTFDTNAYNEYEYINLMQELNQSFDKTNDLHITERFLKGE